MMISEGRSESVQPAVTNLRARWDGRAFQLVPQDLRLAQCLFQLALNIHPPPATADQ